MFRRRDPAPIAQRVREFLSPRKGWQRSYRYVAKRMQRLPDTPHRIGMGFACGVLASFTPFFGLHFLTALLLAVVTRGNLLAAAAGTFAGNPITFPFIAAVSIWLGRLITGIEIAEPHHGMTFGWMWDNVDAIFIPYLVGGLLPGLISAAASYWVLRPIVAAYQARRRGKLVARARERVRQAAGRRKTARAARKGGGGVSSDGLEDGAR
ncbi:MAG: DUF2062 domain-containing protein [Pseudomonadota bacterium]